MILNFFRNNSAQQSVSNNSLEERLNKHPQLKARVEALLNVVENTENYIENANVAEQKAIEEIRLLGQEVLEDLECHGTKSCKMGVHAHFPFGNKCHRI